MSKPTIMKGVSYLLAIVITCFFTIFVHNEFIRTQAQWRIKGGYAWLGGMSQALEAYKKDKGQYPKKMTEALDPKHDYAAKWVQEKVDKGVVKYLPIPEGSLITRYILTYEMNPNRFNVTFIAFGGAALTDGDWATIPEGRGEAKVYIWPGGSHPERTSNNRLQWTGTLKWG